ncbi:hypothetical protein [Capnocytophaga gingivalis]|jgi:hypothetical protein|uniref:hypothetical protein n=1 Tax=Capnocytophaga gingivalis TaxID=1017 RepID=UPI002357530F|nr:hypothetical protein [Capnocytophaga gingivalis]
MKLTTLLEIKGIDPLPLQNFKPYGGVILMDDNEREVTLQWIRQCNLGFELLPLFSNQESDCVAIYTSGFLKGKVTIVRHDEAVFAPQFKSLDSFLKAYEKAAKQTDFYDWEDIEEEDYPITEENQAEPIVLQECWQHIKAADFISDIQKETIQTMAIWLTPPSELDTLLPFVQKEFALKENMSIVAYAIDTLGIIHQYAPAKPLIAELLKTRRFANYYRRNELYHGEFKLKETLIGKAWNSFLMVITIPFMLLSLLFVELTNRFRKKK